jgi:hypothetical protein
MGRVCTLCVELSEFKVARVREDAAGDSAVHVTKIERLSRE